MNELYVTLFILTLPITLKIIELAAWIYLKISNSILDVILGDKIKKGE